MYIYLVCICVYSYVCVCMYIYAMYVYVCLCVCLSVCLSVCKLMFDQMTTISYKHQLTFNPMHNKRMHAHFGMEYQNQGCVFIASQIIVKIMHLIV